MSEPRILSVLVVEDENLVGEMTCIQLVKSGHRVIGRASEMHQAVEMTLKLRPDVVLMDLCIPDSVTGEVNPDAGLNAAQIIQEQGGAPVVVLTAYDNLELVQRAGKVGIAAYLLKPADIRTVIHNLIMAVARFADFTMLRQLNAQLQTEIAERQRVEVQLRKLTQAVEQSANTVVITDPQGCIEYANPKFVDVTGYTLEEALGQNPRLLKSGVQDQAYYRTMWDTIKSGKVWRGEFRNRRKDGSLYWEAATIAPVFDADGQITNFVAVKEDITARKEVEESLRKTQEHLMTVSDSMEAVIYVADMETHELLFVNQYTRQLFGAQVGDLCWKVLQKDQSGQCEFCTNRYLLRDDAQSTGVYIWEFRNTRTGRWMYIQDQAIRWSDGRWVRLEIGTDITDRRRTEESLQRYAERFKLLHEIDEAILASSSPGAIASASVGRIRQLIPCHRVVVVEAGPADLRVLAADWQAEMAYGLEMAIYREALQTPALHAGHVLGAEDLDLVSERSPLQRAMAAHAIRSYTIVPLLAQGNLIGLLSLESCDPYTFTNEHITVAREVAALLAVAIRQTQLYALAQQEIVERKQAEAALREYTVELEARNAELDAFAHTVAHDLKTPVTALIGFSFLLESRFDRLSLEKIHEILQIITRSGYKIETIINELLLLSSVRKMDEVAMGPLDMGRIVREAQQRLTDMIAESSAEIILPSQWPFAMGYAPWVEEVWANYLSNAIKYGGAPPRLELGATMLDDGRVQFWVRDNGAGLTSDEQAHLFAPFTRLHQVRAEGHGLGLSIVRRIMEKLNGEVGVTSVIGQGSVFSFILPGV